MTNEENASRSTAAGSDENYRAVITIATGNPDWRPRIKDAPTLLEAVMEEHQKQLSVAFVRRVFNSLVTKERAAEAKARAEAKK